MDCSGAPTPGRVRTLAAAAAERRALFRSLLECLPQTVLVAETDDGRTALDYVRHRRFDLALLDIPLRRLSGLTVARQALRTFPGIAVVIISDVDDPPCLLEALRIGVTGYLPATAAPTILSARCNASSPEKCCSIQGSPPEPCSDWQPPIRHDRRFLQNIADYMQASCRGPCPARRFPR